MANKDHLDRLMQGVDAWNSWRESQSKRIDLFGSPKEPRFKKRRKVGPPLEIEGCFVSANLKGLDLPQANLGAVNLSQADLSNANLSEADLSNAFLSLTNIRRAKSSSASFTNSLLSGADLSKSDLKESDLSGANLTRADLSEANLAGAYLTGANLSGANLTAASLNGANLANANLTSTNLRGADLNEADLTQAILVDTDLTEANLANCRVYGISAWDLRLEGATQSNLVITKANSPAITVDDLAIAQFIYLLLNNQNIRNVIDTITSKVVLILGRFTPERKAILEAIRDELRRRDYLPVLFDFEKPSNKTTLETVSTLAHMARFVIADLTDAKSVLQELQAIVPMNPSVPVQPLLIGSQAEPGMFDFFKMFSWVLSPYLYEEDQDTLMLTLMDRVIGPAEAKAT